MLVWFVCKHAARGGDLGDNHSMDPRFSLLQLPFCQLLEAQLSFLPSLLPAAQAPLQSQGKGWKWLKDKASFPSQCPKEKAPVTIQKTGAQLLWGSRIPRLWSCREQRAGWEQNIGFSVSCAPSRAEIPEIYKDPSSILEILLLASSV